MVGRGTSPNGESEATFIGVLQGFGLVHRSGRTVFIPAISAGVTHTNRRRGPEHDYTPLGFIVVASVGLEINSSRGVRE